MIDDDSYLGNQTKITVYNNTDTRSEKALLNFFTKVLSL